MAAEIQRIITNQDRLFGYEFSVEHKGFTYTLYMAATLCWYIEEQTGQRYLNAIEPLAWQLWKSEDSTHIDMTAYADFDRIQQYVISNY